MENARGLVLYQPGIVFGDPRYKAILESSTGSGCFIPGVQNSSPDAFQSLFFIQEMEVEVEVRLQEIDIHAWI
jgi:hypothetical protein